VASVDDDALRQVLLNLLDNAVKYGPEGQEVRVGVSPESAGVRVWVDDEGPGIPPGDRERIWKRFFRLDAHKESAVAGTGIGLTVVRDLVALHGGRSWVEPGERGGARFVVEFPALASGGDAS
jgi:signal transduction histidine kinase